MGSKSHPRLVIYPQKRLTNKSLRYNAKTVNFLVTGEVYNLITNSSDFQIKK